MSDECPKCEQAMHSKANPDDTQEYVCYFCENESLTAKVKSLEMVLGVVVFWLMEARKFVWEFKSKNPKFTHEGVVQDPMGMNAVEKGIEKALAQASDPAKAVEEMGWEEEPPCGICGKIESCCQKDRHRHLFCRDIEDTLRAENKALRSRLDKAEILIARLWLAGRREGWEGGPTVGEVHDEACEWIYERIGYGKGAATDHMMRIASREKAVAAKVMEGL